jgi:hypothetical protein
VEGKSSQLFRASSHLVIFVKFTMFLNLRALDVAALALCSMGTAVNAISLHMAGVEPTATGQIGVNLVDPIPSPAAL